MWVADVSLVGLQRNLRQDTELARSFCDGKIAPMKDGELLVGQARELNELLILALSERRLGGSLALPFIRLELQRLKRRPIATVA